MSATAAIDQSALEALPQGAIAEVAAPKGAIGVQKAKDDFLGRVEKRLKGGKYKKAKDVQDKKLLVTLRRALKAYKRMDYREAALLAIEATKIEEENLQANQILAMALEGMGELNKAIAVYQRSIEIDPTDSDSMLNLGLLAWKMKLYDVAEKFFRIVLSIKPDTPSGIVNLAGTLRDRGKMDDAIDLLKMEIYKDGSRHELWNSLGSVVMERGDYEEAVTFYEECLRLSPDYARAYHNIGYTVHHLGRAKDAFDYYTKALDLMGPSPDRLESEHGRALSMLDLGDLENGFRAWEVRNAVQFRHSMLLPIKAPFWNGEDLTGKRILAMAEQGIGDEIAFANPLGDLINAVGPDGKVFVAVDKRLVGLYRRSFPDAVVDTYSGLQHNGKLLRVCPWVEEQGGVDYFTLFGSTLQHFRKSIDDFPKDHAFVVPDPDKVAHWKDELAKLGPGPYIGLCWRSMFMDGNRRKYYSPIEQWGPVMKNSDATFVNLQYGDCEADIKEAKDRYGVDIHQLDLDLKDDLDTNAALCAALDLTISAPTAAAAISGSVGTETWFICIGPVWPMLGTDHFPWYPNTRVIYPQEYANWREAMTTTGAALDEYVTARG